MRSVFALAAAVALGGCAVTGIDSRPDFACQAPEGVQCMTTAGVYYNSLANNLPALRTPGRGEGSQGGGAPNGQTRLVIEDKVPAAVAGSAPTARSTAAVGKRAGDVAPGGGVRAVPRMMRIWVAPWEDSDGDLHDQAYLYITLDSGRWLLERARDRSQPTATAGTSLLQGDAVSGQSSVDSQSGKSTFARELDKLAPADSAGAQ
ncbi:type IV conjugative transfer system lipoprotein TraV [Ramlibacter humi]|uniref:Type IV conjugative transfer system protein TraV n=1 Tax=Ramlibacter humi TaxID=2530451 RepID=A0A4Z0BNS9_9BURK|nr:type IV conjugative transfer system lipoprotein TraV [Ramlibacter humi]TFZ00084.1 type IV conjugative transfer system protein TraV [Ramlibacter humi]